MDNYYLSNLVFIGGYFSSLVYSMSKRLCYNNDERKNMSKEKFGGNNTDNIARETAWDTLAKLNQENPNEPREVPKGSSEEFKSESKTYRKIGEELYPELTEGAKEKMGIRDGQDLGEAMQEKSSWDKQVSDAAGGIDEYVSALDDRLRRTAENEMWNIDGSRTELGLNYDRRLAFDEKSLEERREIFFNFLGSLIEVDGNSIWNPAKKKEVSTLEALVYIAADMDVPKVNFIGHTQEDLKNAATAQYMDKILKDEKSFEEIKSGPTYRMIQRAVEVWKDDKDGRYKPVDDDCDGRKTSLYKEVSKLLSDKETERPFGEE